jgi:hypothetical protein
MSGMGGMGGGGMGGGGMVAGSVIGGGGFGIAIVDPLRKPVSCCVLLPTIDAA